MTFRPVFRYDDIDFDNPERKRIVPPYRKTFDFPEDYINENHAKLANAILRDQSVCIEHPIYGNLRRADAAKIYELAYFSKGPAADIGTNRGLSAAIIGNALFDSGNDQAVISVDLSERMTRAATKNLAENAVKNVLLQTADATRLTEQWIAEEKLFGFIFVDHTHYYEPVKELCQMLDKVLLPDAFVAFHDFLDGRNWDPASKFGVIQAARDGLSPSFHFYGGFGCTGIYRLVR
jgi:predicted O-methyltransferase YrrM